MSSAEIHAAPMSSAKCEHCFCQSATTVKRANRNPQLCTSTSTLLFSHSHLSIILLLGACRLSA